MACALATASAFAVESANIAGYLLKEIPAGYTDTCQTFWEIGSVDGTTTIGKVIPNDNFACGEDTIEIFEDGDTAYFLTYYSQAFITRYHMTCDPGWYDYDDEECENCLNDTVELFFGQAFTAYTESDDVELLYFGEVKQDDFDIETPSGYTDMGNASPVDLTIGDFVPNANFACGEDTVEIFEDGDTAYFLTYYSQAFITRYHMTCDPGWYDYDDEECENCLNDDVTILAGQGFTVYTESDDVTVTVPTAIPAANN